ncbi:MAG: thioesterase family protein [Hyphomonadaceae bacterium]|nr:thioesterase family protein [Hyphomonadaceae bacterium]
MDLFFTLLVTVFRSFSGRRTARVWTGTTYTFKPKPWDRDRNGQLFTSRIPSYIDISLVKFFVETKMSGIVRRRGWIPIVLSSVQVRSQSDIPTGRLSINTRVVGWQDQYVEMWHTWTDEDGKEILRSIYLTRVTQAKRQKVTGADMLEALGEEVVERPLSPTAMRQLSDYFRIKEANRQAGKVSADYANSLKLTEQP